MRQPVVITLIIMGALLAMAPLFVGAYDVGAITHATANIDDIRVVFTGQIPAYPWVCLGLGMFLIAVGIAGEWLSGRRPASAAVHATDAA